MKTIWVELADKNRFIESICGHHITEICEPFFKLTTDPSSVAFEITKYYRYRVDITDEEYVFLKLQFDLKEELWKKL